MQNAGLAALGLNWRYLACEVRPQDLGLALEGARCMGFIGLNLTVPHKMLAVGLVHVLDESARQWGAVNTVRFEGRTSGDEWRPLGEFEEVPGEVRAKGFNTDAEAITRALTQDLGVTVGGSRVLVLGAGGAGRTAALKLASESPAELFLVNRTVSKAEAVAHEIGQRFPQVSIRLGYPGDKVDLAINATSLGLRAGDALPYDDQQFSPERASAVYDMIYRPAETRFLGLARQAGCRTSNGLGMLLYQGARALELWTGKPAPLKVMRQALERNVYAG
jgi:shikimate dehydrogenase